QFDRLAAGGHGPRRPIESDVAGDQGAALDGAAGTRRPPQDRLHPGDPLAWREGLGDVGVRAGLEPRGAVDVGVAGAEDQDRAVGPGAQPPADLEAIDAARETEVEDDEADRVAAELLQRLLPGASPDDAEPVAPQVGANEVGDRLLVLDD